MKLLKILKTANLSLIAVALLAASSPVPLSASSGIRGGGVGAEKPRATLQKTWIDFDVKQDGKDGMRVHAAVTVYEMKGVDGVVRFTITDEEGKPIDPFPDGETVEASASFKPGTSASVYEDISVFFPYETFGLESGDYELGVDVDVCYPNGDLIEHLTVYAFEFSQGDGPSLADAKLVKKWIEFDVTRGGRKGMVLHVKLDQVKGLKGVSSQVVVRIKDADEKYVRGVTGAYSNDEGEFCAAFGMKPQFDPARYDDAEIFMPYEEIALGKGTHTVSLDIDLALGDGELIKHLDYYQIDFKR